MAAPSALYKAYPIPPVPVSKKTYCIAGILASVYGLEELRQNDRGVACLWLLHPRLQTQEYMEPVAFSAINSWNEQSPSTQNGIGLIAVSFDQRNHGSREVDALANQDWRSGNPRHAQDMFASYRSQATVRKSLSHGTATDTSHLLTHISSYIFPNSEYPIVDNLVCGISLGGHAAWHYLIHDPRISAAVIIVGCPDYLRLMTDRARLTKLASWTASSPPGAFFLGSPDFPKSLVEAVSKYDPAGVVLGVDMARNDELFARDPTDAEKENLRPLMRRYFHGKRVLNMSGGMDKLVPYRCGGPFLRWLNKATGPMGWCTDIKFFLNDLIYQSAGHEMTPGMAEQLDLFVVSALKQSHRQSPFETSNI